VVSVCSEVDRNLLEAEYGSFPSVTIPNGVDTVGTTFTPLGHRLRRSARWRAEMTDLKGIAPGSTASALFVGSWHPPNVDALHTILDLAPRLPDVAFLVAGSVCSENAGAAIDLPPNVAMLGTIPDATKHMLLSSADVALNPMTRGSGTNLKVLEYFAAGVPTISTDVGVRGLDVEDGRHLVISPVEELEAALTHVRADKVRAAEMTVAAREMVETTYEWQILGRRLANAIASRVGVRV
jgi:glycosyltransferase involved in cell wall biosynthesis